MLLLAWKQKGSPRQRAGQGSDCPYQSKDVTSDRLGQEREGAVRFTAHPLNSLSHSGYYLFKNDFEGTIWWPSAFKDSK